jgi:hypothetical protein
LKRNSFSRIKMYLWLIMEDFFQIETKELTELV